MLLFNVSVLALFMHTSIVVTGFTIKPNNRILPAVNKRGYGVILKIPCILSRYSSFGLYRTVNKDTDRSNDSNSNAGIHAQADNNSDSKIGISNIIKSPKKKKTEGKVANAFICLYGIYLFIYTAV